MKVNTVLTIGLVAGIVLLSAWTLLSSDIDASLSHANCTSYLDEAELYQLKGNVHYAAVHIDYYDLCLENKQKINDRQEKE